MNRFVVLLLLAGFQGQAQLHDINFNYVYNAEESFSFFLKLTERNADSVTVVYQLQLRDTSQAVNTYSILWETFGSLSDKTGEAFTPNARTTFFKKGIYGSFSIQKSIPIIAAKVIKPDIKTAWYFFKPVSHLAPAGGYLMAEDRLVDQNFVRAGSNVSVQPPQATVFYYRDNFPAATPPFSETQLAVSEGIKPDSVFTTQGSFAAFNEGLFLIQHDTATNRGVSVRAVSDYPKFSRLESLVGPLTYITTRSESQQLINAQRDKAAFDKVVLQITGSAERARLFMRNYFRRVEQANLFFTSYKEGWKTDRGMIFIIFGVPDHVYKFSDREVWEYKNLDGDKHSFTFVLSSSVFDTENYVLVRKRNLQNIWLEAVDLNRNARF